MKTLRYIAVAAVLLGACKGEVAIGGSNEQLPSFASEETSSTPASTTPGEEPTGTDPQVQSPDDTTPVDEEPDAEDLSAAVPAITAEETTYYLRSISQMLVSRPLNPAELEQIEAEGPEAIRPIVEAWTDEPGFVESARYLMEQKLKASGERDGIDFNLPGNLVAHVVRNDLPWSTILTADYCIDASGNQIECDTGAPYTAGVLTTRAFLAGNASRFNLGRASGLMNVFACRIYPMEADLQPRLPRERLIPMFQADSPDEQTVEEAKGGFGNGFGCYSCHGQFSAHAQLFVKYDETGMYRPDATGLQDPEGELGRSFDGLMTSHLSDPEAAALERSQMFGEQVENLAEAAQVLAQSDVFLPCTVQNVITHTFGLSESAGGEMDKKWLTQVGERIRARAADPSLADIVAEVFVDPRVVSVVLESRGAVE